MIQMSLGKGGNAGRVAGGEAVVLGLVLLAFPVVALILRPVSLPLLRRRLLLLLPPMTIPVGLALALAWSG